MAHLRLASLQPTNGRSSPRAAQVPHPVLLTSRRRQTAIANRLRKAATRCDSRLEQPFLGFGKRPPGILTRPVWHCKTGRLALRCSPFWFPRGSRRLRRGCHTPLPTLFCKIRQRCFRAMNLYKPVTGGHGGAPVRTGSLWRSGGRARRRTSVCCRIRSS